MAVRRDTVLGYPLSPALLERIGAVSGFPALPAGWDPAREWSHSYLMWACHGHDVPGNFNAGFCRVERRSGGTGRFALHVSQRVALLDGLVGITEAEIQCADDRLASPISWTLASRFSTSDGVELPDLAAVHTGWVGRGLLELEVGGRTTRHECPAPITGDWCLLEALQRLPLERGVDLRCDILERMTALKRHQRITSRADRTHALGGLELACVVRLGPGTLPHEYWVDAHHRLVLVVAYNYILCLHDRAEEIYLDQIERRRRRGA